jgi:hypothetical protein
MKYLFVRKWAGKGLCRMLDAWPELVQLLKGNERGAKAVAMFKDMLRDPQRLAQTVALRVLVRINEDVCSNLPICGTGDERMSIIKKMDNWIDAWLSRDHDFHEYQLQKMKEDGFGEISQWEAFVEYLKDLDHDLIDRNGRQLRQCKERTWIVDETETHFKQEFQFDPWPPQWCETNESLMSRWKSCKTAYRRCRMLYAVSRVVTAGGTLPPCIVDILEDIAKRALFVDSIHYANWLSYLLLCFASSILEIDDSRRLPNVIWELTIGLLLLPKDPFTVHRDELLGRNLCEVLDIWPEMQSLLNENEKAVQKLHEMLYGENQACKSSALAVLLRIEGDPIGNGFPCCGKVGDDRISALKRMDVWICNKKKSFREDELKKMKASDWMSSEDIERWEAFAGCLKGLESVSAFEKPQ